MDGPRGSRTEYDPFASALRQDGLWLHKQLGGAQPVPMCAGPPPCRRRSVMRAARTTESVLPLSPLYSLSVSYLCISWCSQLRANASERAPRHLSCGDVERRTGARAAARGSTADGNRSLQRPKLPRAPQGGAWSLLYSCLDWAKERVVAALGADPAHASNSGNSIPSAPQEADRGRRGRLNSKAGQGTQRTVAQHQPSTLGLRLELFTRRMVFAVHAAWHPACRAL